jgi:hypothetical protein
MRFGLIVLMTLMAHACSSDTALRLPTAPNSPSPAPTPTPTPNSLTNLYGFVVESSGACIKGASVQIVRREASSQSITQITPCAWTYSDGFICENLTAGVEVTIRASATGYATKEMTAFPSREWIIITLPSVQ